MTPGEGCSACELRRYAAILCIDSQRRGE